MPTFMSLIKIISSIPFILIPSRTDVGVFTLRLLMWIYHFMIYICLISIILNTRNCWINFNVVAFDTMYLLFWFWSAQINFFFLSTNVSFWLALLVVVDRCKEVPLWWWSNPISSSEGVFLCSFIASNSPVLAFSTLIFYSIYILALTYISFYFQFYSNLVLQLLHYL